jgi:hypothetical protein
MARTQEHWIRRKSDGNLTGGGAVTFIEVTRAARGSLSSIQLRWDATLVTSAIALETTNLPEKTSTNANDGVAFDSTTAGDWKTETAVTFSNAATALGGDLQHVGNMGAKRMRLKFTVTTAGSLDILTCEQEA